MKQLRITVAGQTFDVTVETVGGCAPVVGAPAPAPVAAPVAAPAAAPAQPRGTPGCPPTPRPVPAAQRPPKSRV